ncbi:MAG: hypothetical protein ACRESC_08745, partial [Gammaproteobacteria bacterium]
MKYNALIFLLAVTGLTAISRSNAAPLLSPGKVDQAALASLPVWKGKSAQLLTHIDLTVPFATRSQWTLVVAQDLTPHMGVMPGYVEHGPLVVCFVKVLVPHCTESQYGEGNMSWYTPVYRLMEGKLVYAGSGNTQPL